MACIKAHPSKGKRQTWRVGYTVTLQDHRKTNRECMKNRTSRPTTTGRDVGTKDTCRPGHTRGRQLDRD